MLLLREVEELRRQLALRGTQARSGFPQDLRTPLHEYHHFDREENQLGAMDARGANLVGFSFVIGCHP